jgi:DNA helicase-2/ATP-dependent DNA helicase PcrA
LTNAAADELERRLHRLGVEWRSTLFVGTVHSFALRRVVVPFAGLCGLGEFADLEIASDEQGRRTLSQAIGETYSGADQRFVDSTVRRLRKMMDAEEWERAGGLMIEVNRRFEELLHEQGLTDFDQVIERAVTLVEEYPFVRKVLAARYPLIFVDEYQDLAPGLDRLVNALCFSEALGVQLFAVGDPFQSIYGWTGSRPELLDQVSRRPGVTLVALNVNYRSGEEIIRISSRVLSERREIRGLQDGGSVRTHHVPDGFGAQLKLAAEIIQVAHAQGSAYEDIAVLCQSNAECLETAEFLRSASTPVFVRDNDEYRMTPATTLVEALAAWALLPRGQSGHSLSDTLRRWRTFVEGQDIALVELLLAAKTTGDRPAVEFVDKLMELGLRASLSTASRREERIEVSRLLQSLTNGRYAGITLAGMAERARAIGRVYITTMTASKGLEFDSVILLGVEDGKLPFFNSTGAQVQEDRRKFYVSLTRARHEIHILYSGWFRWPSGSIKRDGPSPFIRDLELD